MDETPSQAIREAFPDGRPPPRPHTGHNCPECDEVDAILGDRVWSDVAANFPTYCHDAFPLLTPAAKAYYLPAYMIAALGPECGIQGHSLESALEEGGLTPAMFTPAQRAAVLQWAGAYYRRDYASDPPTWLVEQWQAAQSS